jgi:hypothetical protein
MTKEKFEPARIIGKVDTKKDDKGNSPDENSGIEPQPGRASQETGLEAAVTQDPAKSTIEQPLVGAKGITTNSDTPSQAPPNDLSETAPPADQAQKSATGLIDRYAEQDSTNPSVYLPEEVPAARPTVKEMVDQVKRFIAVYVAMGLDAIGAYLLTNVFDGNFKKALSKDPYKGTSLNDLAKHKEMPLSRQRLAECIRAAAVGAELESLGLHLTWLTFYHKVEISRIKNPEMRMQVAVEAHEKELTVNEVRDKVKKLTGKSISADKRMVKTLIRQLRDVARLTADDETREFLLDKDRLKEALDKGETAQLLDSSEEFRKASAESRDVLQQLETTLEDIVLERRQDGGEGPEKANA